MVGRKSLLPSNVDTHLAIESTSGLLQIEVVIELGIRQVVALQGEIVLTMLHGIGQRQVVGRLRGHCHLIRCAAIDLREQRETVCIEKVVGATQQVALATQVVSAQRHVSISKLVRQVGHACPIGQVGLF